MRTYKCGYNHCLHKDEPVSAEDAVVIGKKRYHKDCALTKAMIEECKNIYFQHIDCKSDYVQTVGVINNLVFNKKYEVEYVRFTLMWLALRGATLKSPYSLHYAVNNNHIVREYKNPTLRQEVQDRFAYRFQ